MALRRRGGSSAIDVWPGYVDALSTLLMVITFVLLVFVLAQAFLSVSISGKDAQLESLTRQIAQLSDMLSLERSRSAEFGLSVASLNRQVQQAEATRDNLNQQLATLNAHVQAQDTATAALRDQRDNLLAQLSDAQTEAKSADGRLQNLQASAANAAVTGDLAGKAAHDAEALSARQDAQIALLNQQVAQLRLQLAEISAALDLAQTNAAAKTAQISDLTQKLNVALASKVEELQRYRSEFFGRLREVLAGRPGITIVGDRFVFQSEVLFPTGSADMIPAGRDQIRALATTLLQISKKIPPSLSWIMRVDGHADHQPLSGNGKFNSNWELSAERAINVVKLLIVQGVPASHLAATAFADNQPLATGGSPADYAKNRRIELRLTDR